MFTYLLTTASLDKAVDKAPGTEGEVPANSENYK